eukprot:gene15950-21643_t
MNPVLKFKNQKLRIDRDLNSAKTEIDLKDAYWMDKVTIEQTMQHAKEYYAASRLQGLVKGFLARIVTRKMRLYKQSLELIQRGIRGKLGRMKWKREYWRSMSIVKSDTALEEIIKRSTLLREAKSTGKSKYLWKEYFDPLTDSFWYLNEVTKHNTWNCPLVFQGNLVCHWDGYYDFGGLPNHQACRCVFSNMVEYQGHLRSAHRWYCAACNHRNSGLVFPLCSLCGNKYNADGMDGEKILRENIEKIKKKLDEFVSHDVLDKDSFFYTVKN